MADGGDERRKRVVAALAGAGAGWAVLTTPASITYATGHVPAPGSPFDGGPPVAVITRDGGAALVVADIDEPDAAAGGADVVTTYHAFSPAARERRLEEAYADAVLATIEAVGVSGPPAVEARSLPASLMPALGDGVVAFDAALERARLTKTAAEIGVLRRAAELTAVGQHALLAAMAAGLTELELFGAVRLAMEAAAGGQLQLVADLLSGERTLGVMGPPGPRRLRDGDPVLCDLVPMVDGYWGDSCTTPVVGEPTAEFARLHAALKSALEHAADILRPGMTAGDLDAEVRGIVERAGYRNPIHSGHGIGTESVEAPRIVPGDPTPLEPGMVLMLEPGGVLDGVAAARLEWMFLITDDGAEMMSPFAQHLAAGERT
jgi:Xaa-Pro dipeptidase